MPTTVVRTATLALLLASAGSAGAQETARALIERAVKAHGGKERLARVGADRVKFKGNLTIGPSAVPFVGETTVQLPGRYKSVVQLSAPRPHTVVHVLDGDRAGITIDGRAQKVPDAQREQLRQTLQLDRAMRLLPLLSDPSFRVSLLGEATFNGRPALGVRVVVPGQREVRLYFDRATALLVKTEHFLPGADGKVVRQEGHYSAYREAGGYLRPGKVTAFRDGIKVMEAELLEARTLEHVDAAEFKVP
jgi:hypothetical protein